MNRLVIYFALFISYALAENYATYPQVPKTASINGFADPIVDLLPECARDCVKFDTGNTPCPYWDTGCFCVMPQWAGLMGQCVAQSCEGGDVNTARYLASSLCSAVGANTLMMPESISDALSTAAGNADVVTTLEGVTAASWVIVSETGSATASSLNSTSEGSSTTRNMGAIEKGGITSMLIGFICLLLAV